MGSPHRSLQASLGQCPVVCDKKSKEKSMSILKTRNAVETVNTVKRGHNKRTKAIKTVTTIKTVQQLAQ